MKLTQIHVLEKDKVKDSEKPKHAEGRVAPSVLKRFVLYSYPIFMLLNATKLIKFMLSKGIDLHHLNSGGG